MTVIKHCPWCGANGTFITEPMWNGSHGYYGNYKYYIKCISCKAIAPNGEQDDIYQTPDAAREKAIEIWNTRSKI